MQMAIEKIKRSYTMLHFNLKALGKCHLIALVSCGTLLTACQNRVQDDALLGTAFGAAAGALVGHGRGEAIAIGAGLGALTGGVIGQGEEDSRRASQLAANATSTPLTLEQIVQLCRASTAPARVIHILRVRGGQYTRIDIEVLASYPEVPMSVVDYLRSTLPMVP